MPNFEFIVSDYAFNGFRRDLSECYSISNRDGYRKARLKEGVHQVRFPEFFTALLFHMALAEHVLLDEGGRELLKAFLRVSRWPLLFPLNRAPEGPESVIDAADLSLHGIGRELTDCAREEIYKDMEKVLVIGEGDLFRRRASAAADGARPGLIEMVGGNASAILTAYYRRAFEYVKD